MNTEAMVMQRALQLARLGMGEVAPNPMVGCVIIHPEKGIIGEGYHQKFGEAHAEVNAIAMVENEEWLKESTLYVTLEPCSHFGKTPPCADLILEKKIPGVVICNPDPHPLVAGQGIARLRSGGVWVQTGLLEKEGARLNRFFFHAISKKRPFITLKWAQTRDGFLARSDGSSKWISGPESRQMVHKMRAEHQAIWVGGNTLLTDNPALTVRNWSGKNPVRIVADPGLGLPSHLQVFRDSSAPTWVFNKTRSETESHIRWIAIPFEDPLNEIMDVLLSEGIHSVFVEGGGRLLKSFTEAKLWDEACVFTGKERFGGGIPAPLLQNSVLQTFGQSGTDQLQIFSPLP
jgi:diaminohydroxyphosphoribosylaminopyrimidine deaminase/5-amino-6-(5-phosphoribosylamino)uracil reductase